MIEAKWNRRSRNAKPPRRRPPVQVRSGRLRKQGFRVIHRDMIEITIWREIHQGLINLLRHLGIDDQDKNSYRAAQNATAIRIYLSRSSAELEWITTRDHAFRVQISPASPFVEMMKIAA